MSFFPVNQVRLTNVAIVRMKRHGKRFEVAAYKNKVINWRSHIETDIDEVLQIAQVFSNVSKGVIAKGEDMKEAFGTDDHMKVALIILDKGELEVSDKERAQMFEELFRDIATIITDKCINPQTARPYTVSMIEKALRDAHFSINPTKSAKQQALKAVPLLQRTLAIERARMRLRLTVPRAAYAGLRSLLLDGMHAIVDDEGSLADMSFIDVTVEPGCYRQIDEEVTARSDGAGSLAVLSLSVLHTGVADEEGDDVAPQSAVLASGSAYVKQQGSSMGVDAALVTTGDAQVATEVSSVNEKGTRVEAAAHSDVSAASRALAALSLCSSSAQAAAAVAIDATAASSRGTGMAVRRVTQPGRRLACGTCSVTFESADEHRAHARSDFHRYNLKRKARGMDPVSLDVYEAVPIAERVAFVEDYVYDY